MATTSGANDWHDAAYSDDDFFDEEYDRTEMFTPEEKEFIQHIKEKVVKLLPQITY